MMQPSFFSSISSASHRGHIKRENKEVLKRKEKKDEKRDYFCREGYQPNFAEG